MLSRQAVRDFGRKNHLNWDHARLIRDLWPGKLVIKGLLAPGDVKEARQIGCDAVVLSNHGGRQLDYAICRLRALARARPEAGDMALIIDGGIRRGTDVLKALALGADFVLVGRPMLFAASLGGEAEVERALGILHTEVLRDLGLFGLRSIAEVGPDIIDC